MASSGIGTTIVGVTDSGLKRAHNEDSIAVDAEFGIAVLADGMGGHEGGATASRIAVETAMGLLQAAARKGHMNSLAQAALQDTVRRAVEESNRRVYQTAQAMATTRGMGTTMVAAITRGSRAFVGHVGDSRLYRFRRGQLRQVTRDHSLAQELIDKGTCTEAEARKSNFSHVVTRALGMRFDVVVDVQELSLEPADLLLLCSDGLSDMLANPLIADRLHTGADSLATLAQDLVTDANRAGGHDNISVILMRHGEAG